MVASKLLSVLLGLSLLVSLAGAATTAQPGWMSPEWRSKKISEIKRGRKIRGQGELVAHYLGKPLTSDERIWAFCYDCMGYLPPENDPIDGADWWTCENLACPLYPIYRDVLLMTQEVQTCIRKR